MQGPRRDALIHSCPGDLEQRDAKGTSAGSRSAARISGSGAACGARRREREVRVGGDPAAGPPNQKQRGTAGAAVRRAFSPHAPRIPRDNDAHPRPSSDAPQRVQPEPERADRWPHPGPLPALKRRSSRHDRGVRPERDDVGGEHGARRGVVNVSDVPLERPKPAPGGGGDPAVEVCRARRGVRVCSPEPSRHVRAAGAGRHGRGLAGRRVYRPASLGGPTIASASAVDG